MWRSGRDRNEAAPLARSRGLLQEARLATVLPEGGLFPPLNAADWAALPVR
ncbi:MAG: hypothetical protein VKM34_11655 [Cyanobacteriota bacterium]|nr:hypothetical protein [Cyanobacteriota bacterium]